MDWAPSLRLLVVEVVSPHLLAVVVGVGGYAAEAAVAAANIAVFVDLLFALTRTSRMEEGCSGLFDLVACLLLCMLIGVGRQGELGMLMPLDYCEVELQGVVKKERKYAHDGLEVLEEGTT